MIRSAIVPCLVALAGCPAEPEPPPPVIDCEGFGLRFNGPEFADAWYFGDSPWAGETGSDPKPIALGGSEYISVLGTPYLEDADRFTAAVTGAVGLGEVNQAAQRVQLVGDVPGTGTLCAASIDGAIQDGTRVLVRETRDVRVFPAPSGSAEHEQVATPYPFDWRVFVGTERRVAVALIGDDDWRLVDSGMQIEITGGAATEHPPVIDPWDVIGLDIAAAGTIELRVTLSDGTEHDTTLRAVDRVDRITMLPWGQWYLDNLRVGQSDAPVCVEGTVGDALVLGAPWQFSFDGPAIVSLADWVSPNCVRLAPLEPGNGALIVTAGGATLELPIVVRPAS